jgi:NhaA family Na+:H+ antiporter
MATDIAFALGVLSLARGVPPFIKVFLTALAIIDDLGAITIIALFYGKGFSLEWFGVAVGVYALMLALNRFRVHLLTPYLLGGAALWYALHHAGIHATVAGVLTAFAVPFADGSKASPSYRLQHALHHPVALGVMPVFALANAGLALSPTLGADLMSPIGLGIFVGLLLGKPVGILAGVWVAQRWSGAGTPTPWRQYAGASVLAGIGFTMSLFITLLAFKTDADVRMAKTAIFAASLLAGIVGYTLLRSPNTTRHA